MDIDNYNTKKIEQLHEVWMATYMTAMSSSSVEASVELANNAVDAYKKYFGLI